jgi:hypothetical protein
LKNSGGGEKPFSDEDRSKKIAELDVKISVTAHGVRFVNTREMSVLLRENKQGDLLKILNQLKQEWRC